MAATEPKEKIQELTEDSRKLIHKVSSFSFLFPNDIIVEPDKVTLVYRLFFFSRQTFVLLIKDIKTVTVSTGPLFATMFFYVKGYEKNPRPVGYIPKQQAQIARKVITGLILAHDREIDLSGLTAEQIKERALEIGRVEK